MSKHIGDVFEALISGVSTIGFWAETIEHKCEGMISIADLAEWDDFTFVESDYALVGMHTHQRFRIGDKVNIQVARADLERKQIDFAYVADPAQKPRVKQAAKDAGAAGKSPRTAKSAKSDAPKAKKTAKKPKKSKE